MFLVLGNATVDESMTLGAWLTPGQTVVVGAPRRDLGGKGANQAIILKRTGAPVCFVAAIGRDAEGDWVAERLAAEGLSKADLLRVDAPTDRSLIFVSSTGENAIASTIGAAASIGPDLARSLVAAHPAGGALVLQGNLSLETTRAALVAARAAHVRTIVNPSPLQAGFPELLALVDLLVLNEGEAASLGGAGDPSSVAASLQRSGPELVVLTLGGEGALYADGAGVHHAPARKASVVDTTGAGDTFTGVLAAALCHRNLALPAAVEAAHNAAALAVQRAGTLTSFPSRAEIEAIFAAG